MRKKNKSKYPYGYKNSKGCTQIIAPVAVLCQMTTICCELYGKDLLAWGVYSNRKCITFQHPDGPFTDEIVDHKAMALKVTKLWRKRFQCN